VRKELEVLEHHPDLRTQAIEVRSLVAYGFPVDDDLALLKRFETIHALDQRRLAGARRATYDDDLPLVHPGRAVLEDLEASIPLADFAEFDHEGFGSLCR
jgi:hypothetical protein